jgi:uncharacterized protein YbaR (Trm112 family)
MDFLRSRQLCRREEIQKATMQNNHRQGAQPPGPDMYKAFEAAELYCPRCKQAMPVRKRLLLVLPEGEKYEYRCARCSESVGTKLDRAVKPIILVR